MTIQDPAIIVNHVVTMMYSASGAAVIEGLLPGWNALAQEMGAVSCEPGTVKTVNCSPCQNQIPERALITTSADYRTEVAASQAQLEIQMFQALQTSLSHGHWIAR